MQLPHNRDRARAGHVPSLPVIIPVWLSPLAKDPNDESRTNSAAGSGRSRTHIRACVAPSSAGSHLAITRALKSFQVEKTGGWAAFFKMRCGKRGVVSLFVRSAALYCATCRGAAAQRKSPQAFSTVGFLAAIPKIHGGGDEKRREDWAPLVASQVAASSRAWTSSPSSQPP